MVDEDVPRYPPFMKGLPAAPVERILSSQTELITSIEQALAMPDSLYQTIAAPVIHRYATYSHLLPASESHHHRGAGGLFRHGLKSPIGQPRHPKAVCLPRQHHPRNEKHKNYVGVWRFVLPGCYMTSANRSPIWPWSTHRGNIPGTPAMKTSPTGLCEMRSTDTFCVGEIIVINAMNSFRPW